MRRWKISKDMFTSSDKTEIRHAVVDTAIKCGCQNMLTFAADFGVDARMFASALRSTRVLSIENKSDVFEKQQQEMREFKNITCIKGELSEFLGNGIKYFHKFDCVFFDYNCIYSINVERDIASLFSGGGFARDGVFGLTIVKGREKPQSLIGTRLLRSVCCGNAYAYSKNRLHCISVTVHQIARGCGIELTDILIKSYKCHDGSSGVPMMAFVFKTTNRKD